MEEGNDLSLELNSLIDLLRNLRGNHSLIFIPILIICLNENLSTTQFIQAFTIKACQSIHFTSFVNLNIKLVNVIWFNSFYDKK